MREPKLTIAVGMRQIGKTYTSTQIIYQYAKGTKNAPPRKVLIFDINGEYASKFKSIDIRYIPIYGALDTVDIRRVTAFHDNGQPLTIDELQQRLYFILKNFTNGLLIVEDINYYISDSISNDLIGFLAVMRHKGVDVIAHFQTKGKAGHPKLFGLTNYIRIHETADNFGMHKKKFKDNLQVLTIAETLVKIENAKLPPDKHYFYCFVETQRVKILGQFSINSFRGAIRTYILERPNETIQPILKRRDYQGNLVYKNWQSAITGLENELFNKYFGN